MARNGTEAAKPRLGIQGLALLAWQLVATGPQRRAVTRYHQIVILNDGASAMNGGAGWGTVAESPKNLTSSREFRGP